MKIRCTRKWNSVFEIQFAVRRPRCSRGPVCDPPNAVYSVSWKSIWDGSIVPGSLASGPQAGFCGINSDVPTRNPASPAKPGWGRGGRRMRKRAFLASRGNPSPLPKAAGDFLGKLACQSRAAKCAARLTFLSDCLAWRASRPALIVRHFTSSLVSLLKESLGWVFRRVNSGPGHVSYGLTPPAAASECPIPMPPEGQGLTCAQLVPILESPSTDPPPAV